MSETPWLGLLLSGGLLLLGCRKNPVQTEPEDGIYFGTNKVLQKLAERIKADDYTLAFYKKVAQTYGTPQWDHALTGLQTGQLVCLLPLVITAQGKTQAVLAIEWGKTLRMKVLENEADNPRTRWLLGLFDFSIWGRQTLAKEGIQFNAIKVTKGSAAGARMSVSIYSYCYEWMTCTGDGEGNCIGNIVYHSECITDIRWTIDYDYYDLGSAFDDKAEAPPSAGGDGPAAPTPEPVMIVLPPPSHRIADLVQYLACFDVSQPATLTVYADQPARGSDEPVTILGGIGHAFLTIEQSLGGQTIRRTVGFYPAQRVNPFSRTTSVSVLGNDQGHDYDVAYSIPVKGDALAGSLTAILQYAPIYDMENYNCVDFVLQVAAAAGTILPRTEGWWIIGRGANPGAFGEDLRKLPGAVFGSFESLPNSGDCD